MAVENENKGTFIYDSLGKPLIWFGTMSEIGSIDVTVFANGVPAKHDFLLKDDANHIIEHLQKQLK